MTIRMLVTCRTMTMLLFFLPLGGRAFSRSSPDSASSSYDASVYYDQSQARDAMDQACYESSDFWKEFHEALPQGWNTNPQLQRFQEFCHHLKTETPGREIFLDNGQQVLAQYYYPGLQEPENEDEENAINGKNPSKIIRRAYPSQHYTELKTLQRKLERNVAPVARQELEALLKACPLVSDDEKFSGIEENDGDTWQRAAWYGWQYLSLRGAQKWMPQTSLALQKCMQKMGGPAHRFVGITRQKAGVSGVEHSDGRNYMLSTLTPIACPKDCGIVVNGQTASIEQDGPAIILDNTFPHYIYNNGETDRYVLMSECWHPALSLEERDALALLFAAKDRFTVTHLQLAPWGYDDDSLEFALKTGAVHDLDFWKNIGYDRQPVKGPINMLEKSAKKGNNKKKNAKKDNAGKGFGK